LLWVEDNICITNGGDTFCCFALELPEIFTLSQSDYLSIHDFWFRALKFLPPKTVVHKQDIFLKEKYTGAELEEETFLQKATKKHFQGRNTLNHYALLFIGNTTFDSLKKSNLPNPLKKLPKKKDLNIETKKNDMFIDEVQKAIEFINGSKFIKAHPLTPDDIHTYVKNYLNGFEMDKKVDSDLTAKVKTKSKEYNVIGVGDKRVGMYTIQNTKQLPEYADIFKLDVEYSSKKFSFFKGAADDFSFRLPFNHIYNQFIFLTDQRKLKSEMQSQRENLFGARGFSSENATAAETLSEYLGELAKDESKIIVHGHTNLIYYADNNDEFEKHTNAVSTAFKNLDYIASYPNASLIKDTYVKSMFPYSTRLTKKQLYQTELSIALTTYLNTTSYKNDDQGVVFSDRVFNVPIKRDVRDEMKKRIKAWNFMVLAPTGEGKSVLMQHIFRQFNEMGYKLVIFDIGGSFKKLSYLIPKEKSIFFSYEPGTSLGINPFYVKDPTNITVEKLNKLVKFVFQMWKPEKELDNNTKTPLRKLINAYYDSVLKDHSFPHFYAFIQENKDHILDALSIEDKFFDIDGFLLYCSDFVEDGQYAFLFQGGNESAGLLEDKDLVVFEFDKAQDDQIVLSILMNLASHAVTTIIWEDKTKEGVIFLDEAAKFFKNPSILNTVIFYYQAIRKQTGSVGTALQSPTQLPEGNDVNAMVENTQVLYVLHNKQGYEPIVERFKLSEHHHTILKSITPNLKAKNPYTEFALIIGKEIWILRLELPKESFYAYQTDGKEYEQIMDIYAQKAINKPQEEAMELAINEFIIKNQ